ncbi:MAG: FHA domain-containing protein [Gemmataceae bacterium]|nr:FHA domain-containing protein [Gemmataceae bacterium]
MASVTFQVLEGIDKGRVFRGMPTPVTIGREEGNILRLNDERVSRFHAKVQQDNGDFILTDLESTNGTRVNGNTVQIRRLRAGDRVGVGRSLLLFGSNEEIAARMASPTAKAAPTGGGQTGSALLSAEAAAALAQTLAPDFDHEREFDLNDKSEITVRDDGSLFVGQHPLPPLPQKMSPAQAARLAEILDFLHRGLTTATENIQANEEGSQVALGYADWQRVLAVQMLLARYLRAVAEPETLEE